MKTASAHCAMFLSQLCSIIIKKRYLLVKSLHKPRKTPYFCTFKNEMCNDKRKLY
jgi:hypothetical protein